MNIFTIFMFVSIGISFLIKPRRSLKNKKFFCVCESVLLILIATLRGNYTEDMVRYVNNFAKVSKSDWGVVLEELNHVGLYVFVKALSYISTNIQFFYGVLGVLFVVAVGLLIYRDSKDPLLSYVILVPMGYFAFVLTGIAQGLAMSLLIFSYIFLRKKWYVLYFLFVILATVCHTTAIIGLLLIVLSKLKVNQLSLGAIAVGYVGLYINKDQIGEFLIDWAGYRNYEVKETMGGIGELLIYLSILLVAALFLYRSILINEELRLCVWVCFVGTVIFSFVPILTEFFRLAMYFNIFIVLLIPEIIAKISKGNVKYGQVVRLGIYVCLFVVYFGFTYVNSSMDKYMFFWQ